MRENLEFRDGDIMVPTTPGLGVELIEEACARYPYQPYNVPIWDGSIHLAGIVDGDAVVGEKGG